MSTFLVTGSSGYIGSHLVHALVERGQQVVGLDLEDSLFETEKMYFHIQADLREKQTISGFLNKHQIDGLFHLASSSSMPDSYAQEDAYLSGEIAKTDTVIQLARETPSCNFISFASSCSVYGNVEDGSATEDAPLKPISPYARAKIESEVRLAKLAGHSSYKLAIFRFFNVIGRDPESNLRENHKPETHLLPNVISAATRGTEFEIFGLNFDTPDGSAIRDFVDVRDLVNGIIAGSEFLLESGRTADTWNLSSDQPHSVLQVVAKVDAALARRTHTKDLGHRRGDPPRATADCSKAIGDGFWRPKFDLGDSISSLLT